MLLSVLLQRNVALYVPLLLLLELCMCQSIDVHSADPWPSVLKPEGLGARVHKEPIGLHVCPKELRLSHHVVPVVWLLVLFVVKVWMRLLKLVKSRRENDLRSALVALSSLLASAPSHRAKVLLAWLSLWSFDLAGPCLASLDCKVLLYQCHCLRIDLRKQIPSCARTLDQ